MDYNLGYSPVLAGEIFAHVTRLDQSWASENIWWNINVISINLLVVYRESVNLIGYITRRL